MFARLFKWLRSLFVKQLPTTRDVYGPKDRLLYKFWDGEKEVLADPMVLYKALMDVWPELTTDMVLARSASKDAVKGWDGQVSKARKVFSVKPFAEGGLTEVETMNVLYEFWEWSQSLKKNTSPTATSPEATSPSSASTSDASPPTSNTSPSGSIGNGNSTAAPAPANSAQL